MIRANVAIFPLPRYEIRAIFRKGAQLVSYTLAELEAELPGEPDGWAVYVIRGGVVQDHPTRAKAEQHARQLNGEDHV